METRERRLVLTLACVQFTHVLDFVMVMPLGPIVIRELSLSALQFSWLVSAYTFAASLAGLFLSRQMDRIGRKAALTGLYGLFALATVACGMTSSLHGLLVARALAGACGGILSGMLLTVIGDEIPQERRGRATGTVLASFALASVVGIPTSLALARAYGWSAPFFALGILSLAVWLLVGRLHLSVVAPNEIRIAKLHPTAAGRPVYAFGATFMLMSGSFAVVPFVSASLVANAKVVEGDLVLVYAAAGTVTFFTSRLFGALSDKIGRLLAFKILAGASVFGILFITHLAQVHLILAVVATSVFMIFNSGRNVPLMAFLLDSIPRERRAGFMVLNSSVQQCAYGIGALLAGLWVHFDGNTMKGFAFVGYFACICTLVSIWAIARFAESLSENLH